MTGSCLASSSTLSIANHNTANPTSKRLYSSSLLSFTSSKLSQHSALCWSIQWPCGKNVVESKKVFAFVDEKRMVADEMVEDESEDFDGQTSKPSQTRPCELYVCNMPRRVDVPDLLEMFKSFGNVLSSEVSKDPETGVSRGCGYVTMESTNAARAAIAALDGSDVDGREMRVRYSAEMNSSTRNPEFLNSAPSKNLIYETPYKVYAGNLPWATTPGEVRNLFSQFGTVVSARVLQDRKEGKKRVYAFLSFASVAERDAALKLDGTDLRGRTIVVRPGVERMESKSLAQNL